MLIACVLNSGLGSFGSGDCDSIAELFDERPKVIQLHNYDGPPVVESSLFEAPLLANRLDKVTFPFYLWICTIRSALFCCQQVESLGLYRIV